MFREKREEKKTKRFEHLFVMKDCLDSSSMSMSSTETESIFVSSYRRQGRGSDSEVQYQTFLKRGTSDKADSTSLSEVRGVSL